MAKITYALVKPLLFLITVYRYCSSAFIGQCCRFYPSCSTYASEALKSHGFLYGCYLTSKRILRCHPFAQGGFDPVPERRKDVTQNT